MGIPFSTPQKEFEQIFDQWLVEVKSIASRGVFVGGQVVEKFERKFAEYCGVKEAIGVGNGTDAIYLALKALNIGPGDEVITVANTFIATVEAIHHTGARPVLVDCKEDSYLIDVDAVTKYINDNTKAIIIVHLYGRMVPATDLFEVACKKGIAIIEDCAQAAGARFDNKSSGNYGTIGCFSFYPDKNLGAIGDGGCITTSNNEVSEKIRKLRNHGGIQKYSHEIPGYNSRLDPIQAAALALKLEHLDDWIKIRRSVAQLYHKYLSDCDSIILPVNPGEEEHSYHLYVIRVKGGRIQRDALHKHLQKKGILTAIHYPLPVHLTPAFSYLGYEEGRFPVSERLANEILSLPMNISITEDDIAFISKEIKAFV
ncbi:DegT/DnrJ/EryC1/StrS family aminotransferase [Paenibacillus sp. KN14-4R]|uniref:DegT/DnrJ/EryC1/StrS family aminotransferase n=1 Tax=Paenibacillus sp. KN14-4R TaxID=3445773 RepID=UPI003F9F7F2B